MLGITSKGVFVIFKKLFSRKECAHPSYKMEADFGSDPIWCSKCGENLEIDSFPLSEELKAELADWIGDYGEWIDMEADTLKPGGLELEAKHDERGR